MENGSNIDLTTLGLNPIYVCAKGVRAVCSRVGMKLRKVII